ncbi:hypothetical protein Bbelb_445480 [Branchiostoma belcheri]|nr:hypothetical protein Bbelb_445480 [Branchiostoma belcheri]
MSSLSDQIHPHGNSEPDVRMLNGPLVIPKAHSASKLRQDRDFWAKLEEKEKEREIQTARQRLQKDLQQNRDIYNHGYFKTEVMWEGQIWPGFLTHGSYFKENKFYLGQYKEESPCPMIKQFHAFCLKVFCQSTCI